MRSPSNVFYTGKSSEKLNGMEKKATHGKEAHLTFRTISQYKVHWRGPHVAFAVCSFQRRLSQAINLINPKGESRTRAGDAAYKIHDGVASPSGFFSADFLKL